ncbi:hypothetical protein [Streptomyces jumonjinensis]|uniref:hypothetical protein n=1 Tax=Streptomyces jumonjinensis TaxID=1945 RepID=UPI0037AF40E9
MPAQPAPRQVEDDQEHAEPRAVDVAADGRPMTALSHRIADGTEPVWESGLDGGRPRQSA